MALMEASVIIKASLGPLKRGLALARAAVSKAVAAMQATISKMVSITKKAFIGLAAVMGIATWAASVQEEAEKRLAVVLKSTADAAGLTQDQLIKQAAALQKLTTYGDETIMSLQALLLTFKEIKGDMFERATIAILDMSTAMGQDLKQGAIQVGKALNDPILGITALRRVGIQFTEAQTEMIKNFVKTGRVAEAQRMILEELESQFGGMAFVVDTAKGSFIRMKNVLGDILEVIGKPFLDNFKRMTNAITEWALTHEDKIAVVAAAFDRLVEVGNFVIGRFISPLLSKLGELADKFGNFESEAKLTNVIWAIGEWAERIWMIIKNVWLLIENLWKSDSLATAIKYGLDLAWEEFVAWGKRLGELVKGIGQIAGYHLATALGVTVAEKLAKLAMPESTLGKIIGVTPGGLLARMGMVKSASGIISAKEGTEPTMEAAIAKAAKIVPEKVSLPKELIKPFADFEKLISDEDDILKANWALLREEFNLVKLQNGLTKAQKIVGDLGLGPVSKARAAELEKAAMQNPLDRYLNLSDEIKAAASTGASGVGFTGLQEAWKQMAVGFTKPDLAKQQLEEQKKTIKAIEKTTTAVKDINVAVGD